MDTELHYVSDLEGVTGKKSDFVLELCQKFNASTYYSGSLGQDYLKESDFKNENIEIIYQKIRDYSYKQLFRDLYHINLYSDGNYYIYEIFTIGRYVTTSF
ncbi:WbqC family protein [Bacillus cereus]|nr:WbqC family protein [Bacillus cereus]MDA2308316.1 WbqC family protein [Bacillus cereus]